MKTFGQELRKMRESRGLSYAAFASELGLDYGTYYTLERGITSAQANSAKSLLHNKVLSQVERQLLKCASKQKKKISEITITDADRLAYQRRKNEKYA